MLETMPSAKGKESSGRVVGGLRRIKKVEIVVLESVNKLTRVRLLVGGSWR